MIKTLIFNGSPRKNGDTVTMIRHLTERLPGEIRIINCYESGIKPCIDCRYCRTHEGCTIRDGMQEIYMYLKECDNIVIASPIYFSTLTGKMLDVASRLQCYFSAEFFQKKSLLKKEKKGAILLAGGGSGGAENAVSTAAIILREIRCTSIYEPIISGKTDRIPASEDVEALENIEKLACWFSQNQT